MAGIVRQAWAYAWSSTAAHLNEKDTTGLLNLSYWRRIACQVVWRTVLEMKQSGDTIEKVRLNTHTCRPLAGDAFITNLENLLNKRLGALPIGRPNKNNGNTNNENR